MIQKEEIIAIMSYGIALLAAVDIAYDCGISEYEQNELLDMAMELTGDLGSLSALFRAKADTYMAYISLCSSCSVLSTRLKTISNRP